MTHEGQNIDRKSLKMVTGSNPRWNDLAKDCVSARKYRITNFDEKLRDWSTKKESAIRERTGGDDIGRIRIRIESIKPAHSQELATWSFESIVQKGLNRALLFNRTDQ